VVGAATAASNNGEILVKRGQIEEAYPILDDAIRTMRASHFHDGAAYAEIQLARILLKQGAVAEADEILSRVSQEFYDLGQAASVLEAVLVQVVVKVQMGEPTAALELLERAANAAGEDAQLFVPQVAEARACALAALDRLDEANKAVETGLVAARYFALPFEEATLLLMRAEISAEEKAAVADRTAARKILGGLGIS
jgi:tetratricopeptide (TPR) repeat protein